MTSREGVSSCLSRPLDGGRETLLLHFPAFVMRGAVFAIVMLIGIGCASSASNTGGSSASSRTPEGIVIAQEEALVSDCTFLTDIQVDPPYAMLSKAYPEMSFATRYEMRLDLRRQTERVGADTVLPTEVDDGQLHGKAYDCRKGGGAGAQKGTG